MIQFFRKIRQKLLSEGKTGKYFKYAIGEIILVVIGILIALQINNWNENKKLNKRELSLLSELKTNLEINISNLKSDIQTQIKSIKSFDYILSLPNNNLPFNDSIPNYLANIDYASDVILVSSAFQTLKSSGLELIRSDSLRIEIVNLFEVDYPKLMQETRRIEDQLWPAVVMPLFQKHLRNHKNGWVPNDYHNWLKDKEFFNMVSFRKNLRNSSTNYKKKAVEQTTNVIYLIEKELTSRK
tara:strand:- start:55817 stop:56539 length:723 start_codon:yes stop_codon:yes gene_type:complete